MIVKTTFREEDDSNIHEYLTSLSRYSRGEFIRNAVREYYMQSHSRYNTRYTTEHAVTNPPTTPNTVVDTRLTLSSPGNSEDNLPMDEVARLLKFS